MADESAAALLLRAALYRFLKDQRWGRKAARALLKKNQALAALAPDFSLAPLFAALERELAAPAPAAAADPLDAIFRVAAALPARGAKPGPLRRVDEAAVAAKVRDNSYAAKGGDGYVERAAGDLSKVRGKNFKAEKSKKKRATWRGSGTIDTGTHSVFFDSDD